MKFNWIIWGLIQIIMIFFFFVNKKQAKKSPHDNWWTILYCPSLLLFISIIALIGHFFWKGFPFLIPLLFWAMVITCDVVGIFINISTQERVRDG